MKIENNQIQAFQEIVWGYYHNNARNTLPWRQPDSSGVYDPYKIMVSELMLQQTQVQRVIPKYLAFVDEFPTPNALANADLGEVLRAWSGLGYNRRAKFLHQAAHMILTDFAGVFPDRQEALVQLPGIGPNTAGAILAYAYNQPVVFIETNIKTVIIHHFFEDHLDITDAAITGAAEQVLDEEHPREWYWALMDYGSFLKQTVGNQNHRSKSYTKQAKFEGSLRQIRGQVLRILASKSLSLVDLQQEISHERLKSVLADLEREGLIRKLENGKFSL